MCEKIEFCKEHFLNQGSRNNLGLVTNRAWGPYCGILVRGRGSMDRGLRGLCKNDRGQYSSVLLKQARLVSSLLHDARTKHFCFYLPALANKNTRLRLMTVHGNGLYGKIPTELEPIRTLRFILRLPCHIISFSFGNFQKQKLYENRKCSYNILWSVHCSNYQSKNILPGVFP